MTSKAPHLLIVSGGRDLPDRARALVPGLRTSVLCRPDVVPRLRSREKISRVVVLRPDAPDEEWIAAASFIHSVDPVDRIANFTDKDVEKTAVVAEALGLSWHSPETVRAVGDKFVMREVLRRAGVDRTPNVRVRDAEGVRAAAAELGYPLICKPAQGVASRGVTRIDDPAQIDEALLWAADGASGLDGEGLVVEPFLQGVEYSVEAVSEEGRHCVVGITAKISEPEHFVELGHVVPAQLPDDERARVVATVLGMLDALGVGTGVTHTEVIVDAARVSVVETHLRPGGDELPVLWARVGGADLIDVWVKQGLGIPVLQDIAAAPSAESTGRFAAIWHAVPDVRGELVSVEGQEAAEQSPGVFAVEPLLGPGDEMDRLTGSFARAAHVCAEGSSAAEALERARTAAAAFSFTVRAGGVRPEHAGLRPGGAGDAGPS